MKTSTYTNISDIIGGITSLFVSKVPFSISQLQAEAAKIKKPTKPDPKDHVGIASSVRVTSVQEFVVPSTSSESSDATQKVGNSSFIVVLALGALGLLLFGK